MWAFIASLITAGVLGQSILARNERAETAFTARDMLSAPRPQPAIPNPRGSHAVEIVDRWDPKEDITTRSVYLLSVNTTAPSLSPVKLWSALTGEISELLWLSDNTVAYLNDTSLYHVAIDYTADSDAYTREEVEKTHLFDFPSGTNPTGLKYQSETGILAWSGQVWQDGDFDKVSEHDTKYERRGDSGVVYDDLFYRHWDVFRTPGKVWTIGATKLQRVSGKVETELFIVSTIKGKSFFNLLAADGLYSQTDAVASFSLSETHIAIAIKSPHLAPALHTRQDVYTVPLPHLDSLDGPQSSLLTPDHHGAISEVTFSPDGQKLAWLEMAQDQYESDRRVLTVTEVGRGSKGNPVEKWTEQWDRSPSSLAWATDSKSIFLLAEHEGREILYHITHPDHLPTPLLFNHSTASINALSAGNLLLSMSSFKSPNDIFVLHVSSKAKDRYMGDGDKIPQDPPHRLTDWSKDHIGGALDDVEVEEFWFTGAEGWRVMGWAMKPKGWKVSDADNKAVWPMAFFVHGGPQGQWADSWSTRWNLALFAAQGYFVIGINPTGSTGYGQEFTDRINQQWGGRPFKDLLAGYHHALGQWPEIDPQRTAMLGGSYGGYMANWIQGHNHQFGFKAIVSHDGIFDVADSFWGADELWFPLWDLGGTPVEVPGNYDLWNPRNYISEWSTPQLTIHGAKDYRLADTIGFSVFTALQVQGVPSRLLWFPDENHWVLKAHNSMRWHAEVTGWLEEWVKAGRKNDDINSAESGDQPISKLVIQ